MTDELTSEPTPPPAEVLTKYDRVMLFVVVLAIPTMTFFFFVTYVMMKIGLLPPSFEHSLLLQIVGVIYGLAFGYVLHWTAFTQVRSRIKYVVWGLMIFLDILIGTLLLGVVVVWLLRTLNVV